MLGTGKLGFSFVRITSLHVSCNRLWIGTGNGVVISVPLADGNGNLLIDKNSISYYIVTCSSLSANGPNVIPKCCMAHSQLSFHGHRDAVKFFVSVPMSPVTNDFPIHLSKKPDMLVMSGGEGYIDFRLGKFFVEFVQLVLLLYL